MGVLYILDEPTIGLHQKDNAKLIATLVRLRDLGNTLIVVEHDEETIRTADWVVDIGPGAGEHGGEVIAAGTLERDARRARLDHRRVPARRADGADPASSGGPATARRSWSAARASTTCKNIDVDVPAGHVHGRHRRLGQRQEHARDGDPLPRAGTRRVNGAREEPGEHDALEGVAAHRQDHRDRPEPHRPDAALEPGHLHRAVRADPRAVRGRARGARARLRPRPLLFNVKGGRCENCKGDGIIKIEMQFLPDVYVPCEVCGGKRYNREALEIHYRGHSIADVLEMTVEEALEVFQPVPHDPHQAPDARGRRPRLHPPRPAGDDAVRRRGAARQAGHRAVAPRHRQDRSTCSTSPPPASTSPTSRSCSRCSTGSSTTATR